MHRFSTLLQVSFVAAALVACKSGESGTAGAAGGACRAGGVCDDDLVCLSDRCVARTPDPGGDTGTPGADAAAEPDGVDPGPSGADPVAGGDEGTPQPDGTGGEFPCVASCDGKSCGDDDSCGGRCTGCPVGSVCDAGSWTCKDWDPGDFCVAGCVNQQCSDTYGLCAASSGSCAPVGCTGDGDCCRLVECDDPTRGSSPFFFCDGGQCRRMMEGPFTSCPENAAWCSCGPRECGTDPCGNGCGTCPDGADCVEGVCTGSGCPGNADCSLVECGPEPVCGVDCGGCGDGAHCELGSCVASCVPACAERECGIESICKTSCGTCDAGEVCVEIEDEDRSSCTRPCVGAFGGSPIPCGTSPYDSSECGSCGEGYKCVNYGSNICWMDVEFLDACTNYYHHANGASTQGSEFRCCYRDLGFDVVGQWPDGTVRCCKGNHPWPCVVDGQNLCCGFPGDTTLTAESSYAGW